MTEQDFRRIALSMLEAVESAHMGHPDFRVGEEGKIFASLAFRKAEGGVGMVKLTPEQQREFVKAEPTMFAPVKGGWGAKGATEVRLEHAEKEPVRRAMIAAWRNTAAKSVLERVDGVVRGPTKKPGGRSRRAKTEGPIDAATSKSSHRTRRR